MIDILYPVPRSPTWYDCHRLECAEHPESAEGGEAAQVADEELYVGHDDDGEVEPVPAVAEVGELVEDEAARQDLHRELETVGNRSMYAYTVWRPISGIVLFCFPSEVLVTNWASL